MQIQAVIFVSTQKATYTLNLLTNPICEIYIFYFSYTMVIFFIGKYLLIYLPTYLLTYFTYFTLLYFTLLIDVEKLLEKYKAIWNKIKDLKNFKLNTLLVYDDIYI